jgi:hypothetical protein
MKEDQAIVLGFALVAGVLAVGILALRYTIEREVRRVDSSIKGLPSALVVAVKGG